MQSENFKMKIGLIRRIGLMAQIGFTPHLSQTLDPELCIPPNIFAEKMELCV